MVEDLCDQGGPDDLDVVEHLAPGRCDPDQDDPPVFRDADPFDEPPLLDPVDETGGGRK